MDENTHDHCSRVIGGGLRRYPCIRGELLIGVCPDVASPVVDVVLKSYFVISLLCNPMDFYSSLLVN